MSKYFVMLLIITFVCNLALASPKKAKNQAIIDKVSEQTKQNQTNTQDTDGFFVFPFVLYMPETSVNIVLGSMYYWQLTGVEGEQPSLLRTHMNYTFKNQYSIGVMNELNYHNYFVNSELMFLDSPDLFFGIGETASDDLEEKYTDVAVICKLIAGQYVVSSLAIGGMLMLDLHNIVESEEGGLLDAGNILGSDESTMMGFGFQVRWDNRDSNIYPTKGNFTQLQLMHFNETLGSSSTMTEYILDARHFFQLTDKHSIAMQVYCASADGNVPFKKLPLLNLRGIYAGRYIDKTIAYVNFEYRIEPVLWNFIGFVFFVGAGETAPSFDKLEIEEMQIAYGGGIRFMIASDVKMNFRFDIAFSEGIEFYFQVLEHF